MGNSPGQGHLDKDDGLIGHQAVVKGKATSVFTQSLPHFLNAGHGMNQVPILDEGDLSVSRIQCDFLQIEKALLKPHFKQKDDIRIQGTQITAGMTVDGAQFSPEIQEEFQPSRGKGDFFEHLKAR